MKTLFHTDVFFEFACDFLNHKNKTLEPKIRLRGSRVGLRIDVGDIDAVG